MRAQLGEESRAAERAVEEAFQTQLSQQQQDAAACEQDLREQLARLGEGALACEQQLRAELERLQADLQLSVRACQDAETGRHALASQLEQARAEAEILRGGASSKEQLLLGEADKQAQRHQAEMAALEQQLLHVQEELAEAAARHQQLTAEFESYRGAAAECERGYQAELELAQAECERAHSEGRATQALLRAELARARSEAAEQATQLEQAQVDLLAGQTAIKAQLHQAEQEAVVQQAGLRAQVSLLQQQLQACQAQLQSALTNGASPAASAASAVAVDGSLAPAAHSVCANADSSAKDTGLNTPEAVLGRLAALTSLIDARLHAASEQGAAKQLAACLELRVQELSQVRNRIAHLMPESPAQKTSYFM